MAAPSNDERENHFFERHTQTALTLVDGLGRRTCCVPTLRQPPISFAPQRRAKRRQLADTTTYCFWVASLLLNK